MLSFKPIFSLSSFTFINRLFSSSSICAITVVLSAYLRLSIFLPASLVKSNFFFYLKEFFPINLQEKILVPKRQCSYPAVLRPSKIAAVGQNKRNLKSEFDQSLDCDYNSKSIDESSASERVPWLLQSDSIQKESNNCPTSLFSQSLFLS